MHIANPIYDVVFKYLLDDEKVARLLLSALLGREVLELDYRATEVRSELKDSVLVLRLDFAATIRLEDDTRKLVLIEIQKAQNPMDVLRFRKYLGAQYANPENLYRDPAGKRQALPIVTIYFLGEGLEHTDAPVVRINRRYLDAATGEEVRISEPFVEALTHDCIVVQIDRLKARRRTELERLLMVFDQGLAEKSDRHLLLILETDYPDPYQEVLRRLFRAIAEKDVRDGMDVEDEYLQSMLDKDRHVAELDKVVQEQHQALEAKDQALEAKDQALEAKDMSLEAKDKALEAKDKALEAKDKALEAKDMALEDRDRLIAELRARLD